MTEFIVVPGIGGSDSSHWQSIWEKDSQSMTRFQPSSWDQPKLDDWLSALETAVSASRTPPVLIAHSLGCLLIAIWQQESNLPIAGAFLVAVPDPKNGNYPKEALTFSSVPDHVLRFHSAIIASTDDPYASLEYSKHKAIHWGSAIHIVGGVGHINGASGLGRWPQGWTMLQEFVAPFHRTPTE